MSSSTVTPRKRLINNSNNNNADVFFEDEQEMINAVTSTLQIPEEQTNVSKMYANGKNNATEVQAYAKIAGRDWTYYVKSLAVSIGRNTETSNGSNTFNGPLIDIDLGPAKIVSRQHATITYNLDLRCWELKVLGRNGARIDGQKINVGSLDVNALHSGAILDVGGTQMMFILPDAPPVVAPKMLEKALAKYNEINRGNGGKRQRAFSGAFNNGGHRSYHVYENILLNHSPSSVSATSLQHNLDEDLSKEESKDIKPPYSYATMITQAILSDPHGVMSLSDIYNWISDHYAYYKFSKTGWQNSIRHNLSLNKAFEKVPRKPNEPGKGMKWQISESYKQDFLSKLNDGTLSGSRKGSSVSRQLSLHLATHKHLPDPNNPCFDSPANQLQQQQPLERKFSDPQGQGQQQGSFSHQRSDSKNFQFNINIPTNPLQYPGQQNAYISNSSRPYAFPPPSAHPQQQPQQHNLSQPQPIMYSQQQLQIPNYQMVGSYGNNLASPLRQPQQLNQPQVPRDGAKLPKTAPQPPNQSIYNLPLQNNNNNNNNSTTAIDGKPNLHSRASSYTTANQLPDLSQMHSFASTNQNDSLSSIVPPSGNTTSDMLSFTSPKKISALEAYTPERGSSKNAVGNKALKQNQQNQQQQSQLQQLQLQQSQQQLQQTQGQPPNQTSPAFWNFVQFSTPNGQTPIRKDSNESDEQNNGSPTMNRKNHKGSSGGGDVKEDDSPFKKDRDQQAGMVDS